MVLCAVVTRKVTVKWRLMFSIGSTCAYRPGGTLHQTGPSDGSRNTTIAFLPILFNPATGRWRR